jgi:hypothetical protein
MSKMGFLFPQHPASSSRAPFNSQCQRANPNPSTRACRRAGSAGGVYTNQVLSLQCAEFSCMEVVGVSGLHFRTTTSSGYTWPSLSWNTSYISVRHIVSETVLVILWILISSLNPLSTDLTSVHAYWPWVPADFCTPATRASRMDLHRHLRWVLVFLVVLLTVVVCIQVVCDLRRQARTLVVLRFYKGDE